MSLGVGLVGFWLAATMGANDVANSMGTSVGTKALSLGQALVLAGILEFAGAIFFGDRVTQTLTTQVLVPTVFAPQPRVLLLGMVAVLLAGAIWLQMATSLGLPVSSSHAIIGAIAGFTCTAAGVEAVNWGSLGKISLGWLFTPLISGAIAFLFYGIIRAGILQTLNPLAQLQEWLPWLSLSLVLICGGLIIPVVTEKFLTYETLANSDLEAIALGLRINIAALCLGSVAIFLYSCWSRYGATLEIEQQFGRLQTISAGFVAFAHGANDVGNAIAPLVVIWQILTLGQVPLDHPKIPPAILILGGVGIVTGLGLWGKKVMGTIGSNITPLLPSGGLAAELATATTILCASRWGWPVSTSHALVGAVVGMTLGQGRQELNWGILRNIALAWLVTIPTTASLAALIFLGISYLSKIWLT